MQRAFEEMSPKTLSPTSPQPTIKMRDFLNRAGFAPKDVEEQDN